MQKQSVRTLLFGLGLVLLPCALASAQDPADPNTMMLAAFKANNLAVSDIQPWHIKASYQLLDQQGAVAGEGTYEEFWAGPTKFKRIFTGKDFTQTDYGTEKGVLRSGWRDDVPHLLLAMRRYLVAPLPDEQSINQATFSVKSINVNGAKLSCFSVAGPPPPPGLTYCIDAPDTLLRISADSFQNIQVLHNRILRFESHTIAGDLKIINTNNTPLLTAHVESLETLGTTDNATLFEPSPDASLLPRRISVSSGVAQGMLLKNPPPIYPPIAQAAHAYGIVVLTVTIGVDGHVKDPMAIDGPLMLRQAAVDSVRTWLYKPYVLNGSPVEVHTTVNVVYNRR